MGAVTRGLAAVAAFAVVLAAASSARASEGGDGSAPGLLGDLHPEVAGRFMASVGPMTPVDRQPPLVGGGPGVRAGVSLSGVYAGLSFIDFMSEGSCTLSNPGSCGHSQASSYGVELGYGHTFWRRVLVRGILGAGDRVLVSDGTDGVCIGCAPVTSHTVEHDLYLAPAVLVAVTLGPVLVGADATLLYMPSAGSSQVGVPRSAAFASLMGGMQLGVRL